MNPPQSQLQRYKSIQIPKRSLLPGEVELLPMRYQQATRARGRDTITEQQWDDYRRHFFAMVSTVDVELGRILTSLHQTGSDANTLIVFTSDHGDYLGDHGLNSKSVFVFDQVYNVPLLIWGPGIEPRQPSTELVELVDVMPTILELLDLPIPSGVRGTSFVPVIKGPGRGREYVYAEHPDMRMIRTADTKYGYHPGGEEVLFDLREDPGEHRNLAANPNAASLLDKMRRLMREKDFQLWDSLPERIAPY